MAAHMAQDGAVFIPRIVGTLLVFASVCAMVPLFRVDTKAPIDDTPTSLIYDLQSIQVPNYTCGDVIVSPCSPLGGACSDPSMPFGMGSVCECDQGFENRSDYCDWGPIPSTYGGDTWSSEKLKRVLMAYTAANVIYYTDADTWIEADGNTTKSYSSLAWYFIQYLLHGDQDPSWYGKFYVNSENGKSSSAWYDNCPDMPQTYETFDTYKFEDSSLEDDVHIGVGLVKAEASPSGRKELLISFGGTFSAASPIGEFYQVYSDLEIVPHELIWPPGNGTSLGFVHFGFYTSVAPILRPMLDEIRYSIDRGTTVTVTGHSLGAAEAVLFAAVLKVDQPDLDVHVYTFGTPRAGMPDFVSSLAASGVHALRVVNQLDLITMVPTSIGFGDSVLHAGPQVTLGVDEISDDCKGWFIGSQWESLFTLPYSMWSGCPYASLWDHLEYKDHIIPWLEDHGLDDVQLTCTNYTF